MIITIDGPTAGGKSTSAQLLAKKLEFYYISSGMIYRALAYVLSHYSSYTVDTIAQPDAQDVAYYADPMRLRYEYDAQQDAILYFDGQDITRFLKDPEMDKLTSIMAVDKTVRQAVNQLQKKIASEHDVVNEGRDMGSAVFPHADVKFFITASLEVRAHRWMNMQIRRGNQVTHQQALDAVAMRDVRDEEREIAPLVIPEGAYCIDTSVMNPDRVVDQMLHTISTLKR